MSARQQYGEGGGSKGGAGSSRTVRAGRRGYGGRGGATSGRATSGGYRERGGSGESGRGEGSGGGGQNVPGTLKVLTNIITAKLSPSFEFYMYGVDAKDKKGNPIDSFSRRAEIFRLGLWEGLMKDMDKKEKDNLKRVVFFEGSFFFSQKSIQGLEVEKLPLEIVRGDETKGDMMMVVDVVRYTTPTGLQLNQAVTERMSELTIDPVRCGDCTRTFASATAALQHFRQSGHSPAYVGAPNPATPELFCQFANSALDKAMSERFVRWGKNYLRKQVTDRGNDPGITVHEAFDLSFNTLCNLDDPGESLELALTCDLRAKVVRNKPMSDEFDNRTYTKREEEQLKDKWIGKIVIYKNDKKCYSIVDLDFSHSARSLPVADLNVSHEEYFKNKGVKLEFPNKKPMIVVEGRRKQNIFFPPELVTCNELEPKVREKLPKIASFTPERRNEAIEEVMKFLIPGSQTSTGGALLPSLGIVLNNNRIQTNAKVLTAPELFVAGIKMPKAKAVNFAPVVNKAVFNVNPKEVTELKVVVFHHRDLQQGAKAVYEKIRDFVNRFKTHFRFGQNPHVLVSTGDNEPHWGAVERQFSSQSPANCFVLDFVNPRSSLDLAYPVIKDILSKGGYISQFVNFKTYSHIQPPDEEKSMMILKGVARQILQKAGARLWWVEIPKELPLPAAFIGVDVFHAPLVYDRKLKRKVRKASVAAIIIEIVSQRGTPTRLQSYTKTFSRAGGTEYSLGNELKASMTEAFTALKVSPASVIVWRDGIPESAQSHAQDEIAGIIQGLKRNTVGTSASGSSEESVPLAYIVCQKRIATKFLTQDGRSAAPSGALVARLQGPEKNFTTFYINGRSPPYSTPKPVRFIIMERDPRLSEVPLAHLTWEQCHNYPNWTGPIKVPSVTMKAHKLAELAGLFDDAGQTINHAAFANRDFFL